MIRARDTGTIVQNQFPETTYTKKDILNQRAKIRRESLGGLTPTGTLIKLFDERNVKYVARYFPDDPDRLLGLVFTLPACEAQWKRFPHCLGFDNTYKTNYLGYPLFVAIGATNCNTTFSAAFGLIDNERKEGFDFLFQGLEALRVQINAGIPQVAITDKDNQMKDALAEVWPDTQQQICIFHINQNVRKKIKSAWKKDANPDSGLEDDNDSDSRQPPTNSWLPDDSKAPISNTQEGIFLMWKRAVYADT